MEKLLRENIVSAMRSGDTVKRDICKLVLGEMQLLSAKEVEVDDAKVVRIIKKMVTSNLDTLSCLLEGETFTDSDGEKEAECHDKLLRENEVLSELLPAEWSEEKIKQHIASSFTLEGMNFGKAMGMVMGSLKDESVDGKLVRKVVIEMIGEG